MSQAINKLECFQHEGQQKAAEDRKQEMTPQATSTPGLIANEVEQIVKRLVEEALKPNKELVDYVSETLQMVTEKEKEGAKAKSSASDNSDLDLEQPSTGAIPSYDDLIRRLCKAIREVND